MRTKYTTLARSAGLTLSLLTALLSGALSATGAPLTEATAQEAQDSLPSADRAKSILPEPREVTHSPISQVRSFSLGGIIQRDSYLSPLRYGGTQLGFVSQSASYGYRRQRRGGLSQLLARPERSVDPRWTDHSLLSLGLSQSTNPAGNGRMWGLQLSYDRSYLRRLVEGRYGRLALGPALVGRGGARYSSRNGNNPVSIEASLGLGLSALYSYRLPSLRFPARLRLYGELDLVSLSFSQEYGESYYELYYYSSWQRRLYLRGPGPALRSQLVAGIDLPLLDWMTLSLGYRLDLQRLRVNALERSSLSQGLLVGVSTQLLPLSGRRAQTDYAPLSPF